MTTTSNPPSPRRCQRILEAHNLSCQGLSLQQIADRLDCARSTVHAYLRDFQLHRAHILQSVAADRLANQVYLLSQPDPDPAKHRQHVAAARELRLLLHDLPQLEEYDEQRRKQAETARNAEAIALAKSRHCLAERDGHVRYIVGDRECLAECPMCHPELYEGENALPPVLHPLQPIRSRAAPDPVPASRGASPRPDRGNPLGPDHDLDEPAPIETDPDPFPPFPHESSPIQTDLDKSEHLHDEFPVPDDEFAPTARISPPPKPVGRQYPVSWDNPLGYIPDGQVIETVRYTPSGLRRL